MEIDLVVPPSAWHRTRNSGATSLGFAWTFSTGAFAEITCRYDE